MLCWKCGVELATERKLSFRAVCEACGTSLHCCKNCQNYTPGKPNDCSIPGTDFISDREANNFCEEFQLLGQFTPKKKTETNPFDNLFK